MKIELNLDMKEKRDLLSFLIDSKVTHEMDIDNINNGLNKEYLGSQLEILKNQVNVIDKLIESLG